MDVWSGHGFWPCAWGEGGVGLLQMMAFGEFPGSLIYISIYIYTHTHTHIFTG